MRATLVFLFVLCAVVVHARYEGNRDDFRANNYREYERYDNYKNKGKYYDKKYDSDEDSKEVKYKNRDNSDEHDDSDENNDSDDHHDRSDDFDSHEKRNKFDKSDEDDDDSDGNDSHEKRYKKYNSAEKYYKKGRFDSDEKYYKKRDSDEKYYKRERYERSVERDDRSVDDDDDDSNEVPVYDGGYEDAVYFSKRKLQSHDEKEDGFFDDVKAYYQREKYVPNYKDEYKRYGREDRNREDSNEISRYADRRPDDRRYYKERHYEIEKPEVIEKEKYLQQREKQEVISRRDDDDSDESGEDSYDWEDDRERWTKMKPLELPPPERPHKGFVKTAENPNPPPPSEAAQMARYVVHHSDWTTVATYSTLRKIRNYPFVNVLSVSDGPEGEVSGIPYLYMTDLDFTPRDLAHDRRCSLSMSLAETEYCKHQNLDPEDPRCAHVTITGEMYRLRNGTIAAKKAEEALFSRHPIMKTWPKDHNFFFATLKMEQIALMDYFGGPKYIDVKDYLRVPSTP